MKENNKFEVIKNLEPFIHFDGVLNILCLLFDIKKIGRLENISNTSIAIDVLKDLGLKIYKKNNETLYVSKNNEDLKLGVYNDLEKNDATIFGKMLGFPDCCIKKFKDFGGVSEKKLFSFFKKIDNKEISSNYLNFFENKLVYHIPCSMTCEESIEIGKKVHKIFSLLTTKTDNEKVFHNKTYIVFKDLIWIKIEDNKYYTGGLIGKEKNNITNKITKGYKVKIISNNEIILYNETNEESIKDIIIFNFV